MNMQSREPATAASAPYRPHDPGIYTAVAATDTSEAVTYAVAGTSSGVTVGSYVLHVLSDTDTDEDSLVSNSESILYK